MDTTTRLPAELVERARAFATSNRRPTTPRHAATVVLLRDGDHGVEAYLLRRHRGMAFAGGMHAFPGGGVDPRDEDHSLRWTGPAPADWASRLSCDEALARALLCAAVRETFEESGVLLAGPSADAVVADTTGADWERDRLGLVDRSLGFAELLRRRSLLLRADLLAAWAHWITPEFEPLRFDTRFFVAVLPAGQRTGDVSGEADEVAWLRPAEAVAAADAGSIRMLPPTYVTLCELARVATAQEALAVAATRRIRVIRPAVVFDDAGAFVTVR
ncbi:MAG: NUDIX domain-containing protein [Actinomycetota bacterium]|nr:NUDIX domain-containing protein [Actinomycetota bacterium]